MSFSKIYRRLAELPVLNSASFISGGNISLESSIRDHVNNTKRTFIQEIGIPGDLSFSTTSTSAPPKFWLATPTERAESIVARLVSPSGTRTALLREISPAAAPKKRLVEIWKGGDVAELILDVTKRHGSFYGDATFSSLCFSPNEDALLYTAEANAPEEDLKDPFHKFKFRQPYGETFIDRRAPTLFWLRWGPSSPTDTDSSASTASNDTPKSRLVQLNPSIPHLPQSIPSSHKLVDHPPEFSLGQAVFASRSGRSVLATAYLRTEGDRKLGIVYCTNRPSMIVRITLPDIPLEAVGEPSAGEEKEEAGKEGEKAEKNKEEVPAQVQCHEVYSEYPARSPRVWFPPTQAEEQGSPNDTTTATPVTIWLSSEKEPHGSCSRLHMMTLPDTDSEVAWETTTGRPATVIDSVWEPSSSPDDGAGDNDGSSGFPGLYVNQLPPTPFLFIDGVLHAVCVSNWGCNQDILVVKLLGGRESGGHGMPRLQRLQSGGCTATAFITCDSGGKRMVALTSSLTSPREVYIAEVKGIKGLGETLWTRVTNIGERVKDLVCDLEGKVLDVEGREPTQLMYVKVSGANDQPLITWPHGGPHTVTPAAFWPELVAFVLCGYTVALPNYTGSLGYGQKWVEALLGKIGTLDVEDVMASAKQMVKAGLAKEGPGMQIYMGGSHGGFLGAHVIGQYPSFFSACVLRNPVINVPAMLATTDIPDWTLVESGLSYDPSAVLTPEQYKLMFDMSPVRYVDSVTTPLLLQIGDVDQRVPPSQGKEYYHLLRARGMGKKVEMLWYPENSHALDRVEAERVAWEAALAWFKRYGKGGEECS